MATKTISVDLEAYECLRRARLNPNESFSKVIKRARWDSPPATAGALLERMKHMAPVDDAVFERWEEAQRMDAPPEDPWKD
jgi:hypothetical protein